MNRTDHLRLPPAPARGRPPTAWLPGLALVLISLMPGPGGAQVNGLTIPAGIMAPAAPFRPKDFALAKYNGQYHLLYINHDNTPNVVTETNLGHAVSPDLRHWTPLPPVLAAHSLTNADYDHIWAPSIIKKGSTYIMYFTGVHDDGIHTNGVQTIRFAISSNLTDWTVFPSWLDYECGMVPWALCDPAFVNYGDFRDPCVIRDPHPTDTGDPPGWLMYYVTHPTSDAIAQGIPGSNDPDPNHVSYVVGMASATYDGPLNMYDLKPLWATHRAYPTGGHFNTIESPTVFSHTSSGATGWFLIAGAGGAFADNLVAWTVPDPTADPPGWTFQYGVSNLGTGHPFGIPTNWFKDSYGDFDNADGWEGAEYFLDDDGREYLCDFNENWIEIRQIKWTSPGAFDLEQPLLFETLSLGRATATNCVTAHVTITGKNLADGLGTRYAHLEAMRVDDGGNPLGTIPNNQVGLPDSVALTSDATVSTWHPSAATGETSTRMVIRLRDPDNSVASAPITVTQTTCGGGGGPLKDPATARRDPDGGVNAGVPLGLHVDAQALGLREARLRAALPAGGPAQVQIFDLNGRRVRLLRDGFLPAGESQLSWDLRDDAGSRVAPGVYFGRLTTALGTRTARVVVVP